MPEFNVPALVQVRGQILVEAASKKEAVKKAEDDDWIDVAINTPIDIVDQETDLGLDEEDEVEEVG